MSESGEFDQLSWELRTWARAEADRLREMQGLPPYPWKEELPMAVPRGVNCVECENKENKHKCQAQIYIDQVDGDKLPYCLDCANDQPCAYDRNPPVRPTDLPDDLPPQEVAPPMRTIPVPAPDQKKKFLQKGKDAMREKQKEEKKHTDFPMAQKPKVEDVKFTAIQKAALQKADNMSAIETPVNINYSRVIEDLKTRRTNIDRAIALLEGMVQIGELQ